MSRLTYGVVIGLMLGALPGCGSPPPATKYHIAVIPKGTTHDFWRSIHAGAVEAARTRGDTRIIWEGPPKEDMRHEQQQIVERFNSEGVHAIILAPCDKQTMVVPVENALAKGIPLVIIDSGIEMTDPIKKSAKYLGYVATDNYQGGVEAAKRIVELIKDKPKAQVVMIRYQTGSESTEQREAGFRATIKKTPNIIFTEAAEDAGATADSAQKVAERLLADRKDLDGIFAPNESSAAGVLQALEVLNRAGTVTFVGFDSGQTLLKGLEDGKLHGLVLQDPFDMGYQAVMRALDYLEGKGRPADPVKHTNLRLVTRENMNDPDIKPLYARDLTHYLGK